LFAATLPELGGEPPEAPLVWTRAVKVVPPFAFGVEAMLLESLAVGAPVPKCTAPCPLSSV
jgi:hypothetical protein